MLSVPASPERRRAAAALTAVVLASAAYLTEISSFPVLLQFLAGARLELNSVGDYISYYNLSLGVGIVFGIGLCRTMAQERIFLLGVLLFSLGGLLFLPEAGASFALLARIIQGFGAGIFAPMVPVLIAALSRERSYVSLSLWSMISGMVAILAPVLASATADASGWQMFWMLPVSLGIISFLLSISLFRGMPERPAEKFSHREYASIAHPTMMAVYTFIFVSYGVTTWLIYMATTSVARDDGNFLLIGTAGALPWGAFAVGSLLVARLGGIASPLVMLHVGAICGGAGVVMFSMDMPYAAATMAGLGMAFSNVPTTHLLFSLVDRQLHGLVSAVDIMAARIGGAFFIMLFGSADAWLVLLTIGGMMVLVHVHLSAGRMRA